VLPESDRGSLTQQEGIVDACFAQALPPGLECWIVNGRHPERLVELLRDGRTQGTRVL
jgi:aspartokinase-like uncharacterized kinase